MKQRRTRIIKRAIRTVAVVGLGLIAGQPAAGPAQALAQEQEPERFRHVLQIVELRLLPPDAGIGTLISGHARLSDPAGEEVGHAYGFCAGAELAIDGLRVVCQVTSVVKDGSLQLSGPATVDLTSVSFRETEVSVVGGTGSYRNASGTVAVTPVDPLTQTYHLDYEVFNVPAAEAAPMRDS